MNTDLKARATRLGRAITKMFGHPVTTAQGLELVAQEENFPSWDAAAACYRQPRPQQSIELSAFSLLRHQRQFGMFIIGPSGTGKHLQVTELLLDQMRAGVPVIVVDSGLNYVKLAQAVGGRVLSLQPDGQPKDDQFGQLPLVVIECEAIPREGVVSALPALPAHERPPFVVIDETWRTSRVFPALVQSVRNWVAQGASFCITGQSDDDVAEFSGMNVMSVTMHLTSGAPA